MLAIDMLTKAYEKHYDIALLLAGDGDFVDLVEAIKDTGKSVCGFYIPKHVGEKLLNSFDCCIELTDDRLKRLIP